MVADWHCPVSGAVSLGCIEDASSPFSRGKTHGLGRAFSHWFRVSFGMSLAGHLPLPDAYAD